MVKEILGLSTHSTKSRTYSWFPFPHSNSDPIVITVLLLSYAYCYQTQSSLFTGSKMHIKEFRNLHSPPGIIRIMSRRMTWEEHVNHMGSRGMDIGFRWEIQKEWDHQEDLHVGETEWGGMDCIDLVLDRNQWRVPVNTVMLWVS